MRMTREGKNMNVKALRGAITAENIEALVAEFEGASAPPVQRCLRCENCIIFHSRSQSSQPRLQRLCRSCGSSAACTLALMPTFCRCSITRTTPSLISVCRHSETYSFSQVRMNADGPACSYCQELEVTRTL